MTLLSDWLSIAFDKIKIAEGANATVVALHEDPKVAEKGISTDDVMAFMARGNLALVELKQHLSGLGGEGKGVAEAAEAAGSDAAEGTGSKASGVAATGPGTGDEHAPAKPKPSALPVARPGRAQTDKSK